MKMPETLFVRLADSDLDCIDPAEVPGDTKGEDMFFTVAETAEEHAQANSTARIAEYRLVRMLDVKSETTVKTSVTPEK